jgi:hypothetical protein
MESSYISGSDMAAVAMAPAGQDVRKRWLLLALALVIGLVAAFAIGSAIKKTSTPAASGSLAQSSSASGQHASITPLTNAGAVPALHAPPPKPKKAKPKTTPTGTSSPSSSSSSVASTSVSSTPVQSSTPAQTVTPSHTSTPTGAGSTPSGTTGVSHGGGGGQGAG